ncbi:serine/threonine-protein kinase [Hamadaea sp. NPDC051192]|uniref:serine/threonine protein kinase n=1 Tax=Hamadaea sp. NPDC051192 TaxID=3154940 RepID=UPI00341F1FDD
MGPWQPMQAGDPDQCGGFRLTHRIGEGGFGTVFLGFRPDIADPAAVKIFKPGYGASPVWRSRFLREIDAIKRMAGAHTAALLDADGNGDPAWLATRYVHAPPLNTLVGQYGAFDTLCAWWLATGLGEALAEIHAKGILHRDLTPRNILVTSTGVKVIDFGISRFTDTDGVTTDSSFFGSVDFTANEHLLDPRQATEKSDVFALGAVLVYVTTGRPPFHQVSAADRLQGALPNLDGVPDELYDLVESCLTPTPAYRPTAMNVFRTALGCLADFAVPLASDSGLPLPMEIRDFVEQWVASPVSVPDLVVVSAGGAAADSAAISIGDATKSQHTDSRHPDNAPPKSAFGDEWRARWRSAAARRRDGYGRRPGSM